jgi:Tol biopolymer transport system component
VYRYDTSTGQSDQIDVSTAGLGSDGMSGCVDMSPDGRYVAFLSQGGNLSEGDSNRVNGWPGSDIFVRDTVEGTTDRVSYQPDGSQVTTVYDCPAMSDDGRIVAYRVPASAAQGENKATVFDRLTRRAEFVAVTSQGTLIDGTETAIALSGNGRFVTFSNYYGSAQLTDNPNGCSPSRGLCAQVHLKDRFTGALSLITADSNGRSMQMQAFYTVMDYSGRYVAYIGRPGPSDWGTHVYLADRGPSAEPLDTDPPSVAGNATSEPNEAGWYNSPVTVAWTATDASPSSGIASQPAESELSTDGIDQFATSADVCDNAGNCSTGTFGPISIDQTAPTTSVTGVAHGAEYTVGAVPEPACEANDHLSGLEGQCTIEVSGGNANGVGSYTATATARDVAGNVATTSVQYRVVYGFSGFQQPIDPTGVSVFRAGGIIPLRFSLAAADGTPMTPLAAPRWVTPQRGGVTTEPVDESAYNDPATTGSLYEARGDSWQYNWPAPRDAGGYYWRIGVALDDGTTRYVTVGLR